MTILEQIEIAKNLLADSSEEEVALANNLLSESIYCLKAGYPIDGNVEAIRRTFQRQSEIAATLNQLLGL